MVLFIPRSHKLFNLLVSQGFGKLLIRKVPWYLCIQLIIDSLHLEDWLVPDYRAYFEIFRARSQVPSLGFGYVERLCIKYGVDLLLGL